MTDVWRSDRSLVATDGVAAGRARHGVPAALSRRSVSLFASVGTSPQPFSRLVRWVDAWAVSRGQAGGAVVHAGPAPLPAHVDGRFAMAHVDVIMRIAAAEIVVVDADPGLLVACRAHGRRPVVVPRRPELGEIGDGRQVWLADRLRAAGSVDVASTRAELLAVLDARLDAPSDLEPSAGDPVEVAEQVGRWARQTVRDRTGRRWATLASPVAWNLP